MKKTKDYLQDISQIRSIMERSSNFISLSGLSGILAGIYALIGSFVAYRIIYFENSALATREVYLSDRSVLLKLIILALIVLILAIGTGIYLTIKKNESTSMSLRDAGFRELLLNLLAPLVSGGLFILILTIRGYFSVIAPAFLIFYGIALVSASRHTLHDIRFLGISEIVLGLICALWPGYGLIFWAIGFGALHIIYGALMYYKYEK